MEQHEVSWSVPAVATAGVQEFVLTDAPQMRILDQRIPPAYKQSVYHRCHTLRWAVPSRPEFDSPTPYFVEAGGNHVIENRTSTVVREIVFELLQNRSSSKNLEVERRQAAAQFSPAVGAQPLSVSPQTLAETQCLHKVRPSTLRTVCAGPRSCCCRHSEGLILTFINTA